MYDRQSLSWNSLDPFKGTICKKGSSKSKGVSQTGMVSTPENGEFATTEMKGLVDVQVAIARTLGLKRSITLKRYSKYSRANPEQYCTHGRAN